MKKFLRWGLLVIFSMGLLWTITYFINSNRKSQPHFETYSPNFSSIEKRLFISGKVIPQNEIRIKPQISGIVEKLYLEKGMAVKKGDLIATIKVIPNEQALYQAKGRVKNSEITLKYAEIDFNRKSKLFDKSVIADVEFQTVKLAYEQARLELENAKSNYQIILKGFRGRGLRGNTEVLSTLNGILMEIPVKEGDQVVQSNIFNEGTTIATIADLTKMNFEGNVNESKVGKLRVGMPLAITLGSNQDKKVEAILSFIAPRSIEESSYVQFKIKGDIKTEDNFLVRSGHSANASLTLDKKDSTLVIAEALLQFDNKTNEPFVEVAIGDQKFERRNVQIGISNGIIAEVVSGLTINDKVKQWNKTEPIKSGTIRKQKPSLD